MSPSLVGNVWTTGVVWICKAESPLDGNSDSGYPGRTQNRVNEGFPKLLEFGWHGFEVVADVVDFSDRPPSVAVDLHVTWKVGGISASIRHERAWIECAAIDEFRERLRLRDSRDQLALTDVDGRSLVRLGFDGQSIHIAFQAHSYFEDFYNAEITERLSAEEMLKIADQLDDFPRWW